jgi:hypothetical protein
VTLLDLLRKLDPLGNLLQELETQERAQTSDREVEEMRWVVLVRGRA